VKVTNKDRIRKKALEILATERAGIHYSEFVRRIQAELPEIPANTIHGNIWNIETQIPEVTKPSRGLYLLAIYKDHPSPTEGGKSRVKEEQFYEPFAEWLVNELEECTRAIAVGGNVFRDKWGTPDVIGVRESRKSDIIKFPTELVSAEVKLDSSGLITAFGQACSYRLFSHRSYIVVPKEAGEDDLARLDSLARIFGIGLILFDAKSPSDPRFEIRVRAAKREPDMFYVNKSLRLIEDELFK
jgi:hypothetical protein